MVHSWNLFEATILPGHEKIAKSGKNFSFGLLNFFEALQTAVRSFLKDLSMTPALQQASLARYKTLAGSAVP
jgi:hypothetical protein